MTIGGSLLLWILNSLLNAAGLLAAAHAWNCLYLQKYKRLFWLIPSVLVTAWLESFLGAPPIALAAAAMHFPVVSWADVTNLFAYAVLGLLFLWISRTVMKRKARTHAASTGSSQISISDTDLRQTLDRFLGAADAVDLDSISAIYAPDFLCVRVADEGGFARLTREQMLSFLKQATSGQAHGHSIPVKNSVIHHAEILGNTALVLVTRVKDLGNGWEPLFYSLLWTRQDLTWHLSREFVHQRTVPNWR
jgi:SnoaL-like domain